MATGQSLAARALQLAQECINSFGTELVDLAEGDIEALVTASRIIRSSQTRSPESERTAEHIAFALLTRAFFAVAQERREASGLPPGEVAPPSSL